ncbi:MAG: helix-turn-helix transcriptional regulator [Acidimicrobiia bacterium]
MDTTPFGHGLRQWRRIRGVSQLELAARASTTTRHVSYLETGRSRPSRGMVERLGDALAIPLRERNRLLRMAGLAHVYPEGDLSSGDLEPFRRVIDRLLSSHEPFPALVLDRHWNAIQTNTPAERLLAWSDERNLIRLTLGAWRPLTENWDEIISALEDRLVADLLRFPDDPTLIELHDAVRAEVGGRRSPTLPDSRVICPRFRFGEHVVRTVTVAAHFESTADVTLDETRVELIYAEDAEAERFFRGLDDGSIRFPN